MNEILDYNNVLTRLTFLTKRNNLSNTEIGKAISVERQAMSGRAERNSKFKPDEVLKIEKSFNVDLKDVSIITNTLERQNDTQIEEKLRLFGDRLGEIQDKHNFLDSEMAKLLKISVEDYNRILTGTFAPDIEVLNQIKRNFKVSIDWLLYGE